MRACLLILLKDLRQRSRDSTLIVFAVVLPLGLAFLFNLAFGSADRPLEARYGVVGSGAFADQVLVPMQQAGHIDELRRLSSPDEGRALAERGELDAVFVVTPAAIDVIGNVDAPIAVQVAREVAQSYATEERGARLAAAVAGVSPDKLAPQPIAVVQDDTLATRQLDTTTRNAAGTAIFFLFFALMFCFTSLFAERSGGTLARLMAAPIPRAAILGGKLMSGVLTGIVGLALLVAATTLLMGASWGHLAWVGALGLSAVLAAAGLMAVVATFARTAEQAANWQSVVATVLGLAGGSFFPIAPQLSMFTPHHWFLEGLAELRGGGAVLLPVAVLLGFALLTLPLAVARVGRMVRL